MQARLRAACLPALRSADLVIVDVVVDCWLYACAREAGRLPLWIELLALSARIGGAIPRGNSILLEQVKRNVQMSRCQNSLTSTSTSTSTVCDGHPRVPKMFNLFLEEALHALSQLKPCPMHPRLHGA